MNLIFLYSNQGEGDIGCVRSNVGRAKEIVALLNFVTPTYGFSQVISVPILRLQRRMYIERRHVVTSDRDYLFNESFLNVSRCSSVNDHVAVRDYHEEANRRVSAFGVVQIGVHCSIQATLNNGEAFALAGTCVRRQGAIGCVGDVVVFHGKLNATRRSSQDEAGSAN